MKNHRRYQQSFKHFKQSILTLIPIGIGMVAGIGVFSYILPYCLENQPLPTSLCFIGLILGGVPFIVKPAKDSLKRTESIYPSSM